MLSVSELAEATGGEVLNPEPRQVKGFSIDTRCLNEGDFFIPLPGSKTDGHRFIGEAFEKGASGAFVRSEDYVHGNAVNAVLVEDTEEALLEAARYHRSKFDIPVVGVTGSWGKTTTKELIASILSNSGTVHKSPGNYNTEYGLPLYLLEMEREVEYGVFELGLQYPGDIKKLSEVLSPSIGLITGAGRVHSEHFPSVADIAREKLQLRAGMATDARLVINADSDPLIEEAKSLEGYRLIDYSIEKPGSRYRAREVDIKGLDGLGFKLEANERDGVGKKNGANSFILSLESGLNSGANVANVLAAASIALELGVSRSGVKNGVKIDPLGQRLNPIDFPGGTVIDDTYNANPAATRNVLEFISGIDSFTQKVFVFGDMKELGEAGRKCHRDLAPYVISSGTDRFLGTGRLTRFLVEELNKPDNDAVAAEWFESKSELAGRLDKVLDGTGNLVLVKGSRSMEMEEIVERLVDD
jgi:UDP-N-acetylmuramoyl-tripeptide--D-alanyl-D-alanine ligase